MKQFKIKTFHQISEDSYKHGELNYVNSFDLSSTQKASNIIEAIILHFNSYGYEISKKDMNISDENLSVDLFVDADNLQASQCKIDLWEKGEIKLYNDYVHVSAYELIEVDFSKIELS